MHLIECPWCGERSEEEFTCGGQSHIQRPDADTVTDEDWSAYLFNRLNPAGIHLERWRHTDGCRQWFNMVRNTVTHDILCYYRMGEQPPAEFQGLTAAERKQ